MTMAMTLMFVLFVKPTHQNESFVCFDERALEAIKSSECISKDAKQEVQMRFYVMEMYLHDDERGLHLHPQSTSLPSGAARSLWAVFKISDTGSGRQRRNGLSKN